MNQDTKNKSTKDKIKEMFLAGNVLTSCDTAAKFLTGDLRKFVSMLRREKLDIVDKWVTSENGKRFKRYWLKKEEQQKPMEPIAKIIPLPPREPETIIEPGQQELKFGT